MPYNQTQCPRRVCESECVPLANVVSDDATSFVCAGYQSKEWRGLHQDRFRHCWKTSFGVDSIQGMDRRDIIDTIAVLSQALSSDECNRVNADNATDEQMNEIDLLALERGYRGCDQ